MRQRTLWIFAGRLAVVVLIFSLSVPALAYSSVEEASEAIVTVAEQTDSEIGGVVDEFTATVGTLATEAAINEAADIARDAIDAIWLEGRDQINDIKHEYPAQLNPVANDAKSAILQARQDARFDIIALKTSAIEGLTSTPTTTSTTTTTSTSTTTPSAEGISPVGEPPSGTNNPATTAQTKSFGEASLVNDIANALTVPTRPDLNELAISSKSAMKAMGAETTLAMAQRLEVFLPPAIAEFVLSPLLIFEVCAVPVHS